MSAIPPSLDHRTLHDILVQLQALASTHVREWQPPPEGDAGTMLQHIFARLLELALQRLNRAPEKHLLAFLDTMGVNLLPPSPARVPLTFTLTPGTPPTLVPQGIQAGTQPSGQQPAVVFATDDDLTVIPAQLTMGFTMDPTWDRYTDQTPGLGGQSSTGFTPFVGTKRIRHMLYLGDEALLSINRAVIEVEFNFNPQVGHPKQEIWQFLLDLSYQYKTQSTDKLLVPRLASGGSHQVRLNLAIAEPIDLETVQGIGLTQPLQSRWLRAMLPIPFPDDLVAQSLQLTQVKLTVRANDLLPDLAFTNTAPVDVTKAFAPFGEKPQLGDAFYFASEEVCSKAGADATVSLGHVPVLVWEYLGPLGEFDRAWFPIPSVEPQDYTFHTAGTIQLRGLNTASGEVMGVQANHWMRVRLVRGWSSFRTLSGFFLIQTDIRTGGVLHVPPLAGFANAQRIDFSQPFSPFIYQAGAESIFYFAFNVNPLREPVQLVVESLHISAALAWEYLSETGWNPLPINDSTASFTKPGHATFKVPTMPRREVNGQINRWIRVRLIDGDYGREAEYIPVSPERPSEGFKLRPGTGVFAAPIIQSFTMSYTATKQPTVLRQTGFVYQDLTQSNQQQVPFAPFISISDPTLAPHDDGMPVLYLGFDAVFPEQPVRLYIDVAPRAFAGSVVKRIQAAPMRSSALPSLQWEYFDGITWSSLLVFDETNNLTASGALAFLTPTGMKPLARFDLTERSWIRARSSANDPFNTQQLRGVFLNTIPAVQAVTVTNETLGSSNGQAHQTLRFARTPVLPGQAVLVHEPEAPSGKARTVLDEEEDKDAVQERPNTTTGETEILVRWHEVANFVRSDSYNRHYTLDHTSGLLTFGDGKRGAIPPRGTNNIIVTYRTGGGTAGNVPQAAVGQVQSPLPGVAAVVNPVAADGGAAVETVPMVQERGPQTLKHRDRAVACVDVEWLARQAAGTRVARAKCMPNVNRDLRFEPGWVTLIIVPQGTAAKLSPGAELIREVEDYLEARAFFGLAQQTPARVNVIGPGYIQVAVEAEVVPRDIDAAEQVKQRVLTALATFFHPLTGGPQGTGWEFARDVYASEVSQVLEGVPGVSHVTQLQVIPQIAQHRLGFTSAPLAVMDFPENSPVSTLHRRKATLLAEPVVVGTPVERIAVKGFKEGDRITRVLDLRVTAVARRMLTVTALDGSRITGDTVGFPRGSLVTTSDGGQRTRLAQRLPRNEPVVHIAVEDATPFKPDDELTVFYPFPMTITSVTVEVLTLTVQSRSGTTITVAPFNSDAGGLPQGSLVTLLPSPRRTSLSQAILPNQTGVTSIVVRDAAFATALRAGDVLEVHGATQTLGIEPYETDGVFPPGSLLATLDGHVRLPLLAQVPGQQVLAPHTVILTAIKVHDFVSGEDVTIARRDGLSAIPRVQLREVEPARDIAYLDDNFLVYAGAHRITMVSDTHTAP